MLCRDMAKNDIQCLGALKPPSATPFQSAGMFSIMQNNIINLRRYGHSTREETLMHVFP